VIRKLSMLHKRHKCDSYNKCFAAIVSHMIMPWDSCKKGEGDVWGGVGGRSCYFVIGKEKRMTFKCISGGKEKCVWW
jgi:hypothetical protein